MQKYLKITGLTTGVNTESLVPVYSVAQVIKDGSGADFNFVLLRNFSTHSSGDIVTISHANELTSLSTKELWRSFLPLQILRQVKSI
jgi:hypothetical protein